MKANIYRNIYPGDICEDVIGKEVKVAGWVANIRDHGGVIFVDLRDETGIVQVVSNDDSIFASLTKESTISVSGVVRMRDEENFNPKIKSGTVEILISSLDVLGKSNNELPFEVITSTKVSEDIRLKYRYLDLRNSKVHENIKFRSEVIKFLRNKMDSLGFTEIQTPILTASSPEGARDYIVPSRKYKGKFYALPQAPQQFKQLLMVGGFDKYYQIAPCFRDEDARADRSPGEFYQLDFEMAYATAEDVYEIAEDVMYDTFTKFSDKKVSDKPFRRITFKESMLKYGTDKPDLRNPLEIIDLTDEFKNTTFKPFNGSIVRGIKVDNIANKPNSWFNELVAFASSIGMPGIGYISVLEDGFKGPIDKFLTDTERKALTDKANLKVGDVLFFIANKKENAAALYAGQIRTELGKKLNLIDNDKFEFCFIVDFPMYEYSPEEKKYIFTHNPFSMPQGGMEALLNQKVEDVLAYQYDIVCNGIELSSGAVRNHDVNIMEKAFSIAGYSKEELEERFKALYTAFKYGAPPHAGIAPGVDRMIMLLKDEPNIREIIPFPMNSSAEDLLMGAPGDVTEKQLREVHIKVRN